MSKGVKLSVDKPIAAIPSMTMHARRRLRVNAEQLLIRGTDAQKAGAQKVIEAIQHQEAKEHEAAREGISPDFSPRIGASGA